MKTRTHRIFLAAAVALSMTFGLGIATAGSVDDLLDKMPAQNVKEEQKIFSSLVQKGPEAVLEICEKLLPPGTVEGDAKVRYALHGLALHAYRPGAEAERKMVAGAFVKALDSAGDVEVKTFLVNQLQIIGKEESVPSLAKLLTDEDLCEPAAQALTRIAAPGVAAAFEKALPQAKGGNVVTLIQGLGVLRSQSSPRILAKFAKSADAVVRGAALYALANIGAPYGKKILEEACETGTPYERAKATSRYLLYARRLAEDEDPANKQKAARICRQLFENRTGPGNENVRSAALHSLVAIQGKRALPLLLKAADAPGKEVRMASLKLAASIPGKPATTKWVEKMKEAPDEAKCEILDMLGGRGDTSALPALLEALEDERQPVRLAAVEASARLGGPEALPNLLTLLKTGDADEILAVKERVIRLSGEGVSASIAKALPEVSAPSRIALLEILEARGATEQKKAVFAQAHDDDGGVRVAAAKALARLASGKDVPKLVDLLLAAEDRRERSALQTAVASAAGKIDNPEKRAAAILSKLEKTSGEEKGYLLETLPRVGGEAALRAVVAETKSADQNLRDAAVRSLAKWPSTEAAPEMLQVAKSADSVTHKVLAFRGYVRVVKEADITVDRKIEMLREGLDAAQGAQEKKLVLAELGNTRSVESLRLVASTLDDETIRTEAVQAALKIALPRDKRDKGFLNPNAVPHLRKVRAAVKDRKVTSQIDDHCEKIFLEGFVSLFNGEDMTGWTGNTKGYVPEDGKIVVNPKLGKGNLYTAKEYSDFVLRFEFKLTPGANNGLGIRAPLTGNAAYDGMELQILDNSADKYKDLKEYQYHGSIYGVVPAKRGHLKPVGEWNRQEVVAKGPQITVILNGETIVDANINEASASGTLDGRKHPGLKRTKGHIAFLGHGSPLEFRNLRIKDLDLGLNDPPEGFKAMFNGKNLRGWKGLAGKGGNPLSRAKMTPGELKEAQKKADETMRKPWSVVGGLLHFDGEQGGQSLASDRDYEDFEILVDWKIGPRGDSGVYLRGSPQVQIWDPNQWNIGSGGLYNNKKNPSKPLEIADNPIGEWNTFRIKMVGERVTIHLNDALVVDDVVLENYWDRSQPIFPSGQLELQCHGNPVYFRNIFIREIPRVGN